MLILLVYTFVLFTIAAVISEFILLGSKIQIRFKNIFALFAVLGFWLTIIGFNNSPLACAYAAFLWSGLFMVWFGVRSHIESSIFLRLTAAPFPSTRRELLSEFYQLFGWRVRLQEMAHAGLIDPEHLNTHDVPQATKKAKNVVTIFSLCRGLKP